jgi:hypothetical protein
MIGLLEDEKGGRWGEIQSGTSGVARHGELSNACVREVAHPVEVHVQFLQFELAGGKSKLYESSSQLDSRAWTLHCTRRKNCSW